jgi:acyl-coenzyme A thioesterase PaaI-like protein
VEVTANGKLVCTGSGGFMPFLAQKLAHPMHVRTRTWRPPPLPALADLTPEEAAIYALARRALKTPGERSFIENFWSYRPRATTTGASATMPIGPHIGNRVRHAQGGITLGLATTTAAAALETGDRPRLSPKSGGNGGLSPVYWMLVAANAWYVGPGTGTSLRARSKVLHRGSLTAVVHTRIVNSEGRAVLECVTSHARVKE